MRQRAFMVILVLFAFSASLAADPGTRIKDAEDAHAAHFGPPTRDPRAPLAPIDLALSRLPYVEDEAGVIGQRGRFLLEQELVALRALCTCVVTVWITDKTYKDNGFEALVARRLALAAKEGGPHVMIGVSLYEEKLYVESTPDIEGFRTGLPIGLRQLAYTHGERPDLPPGTPRRVLWDDISGAYGDMTVAGVLGFMRNTRFAAVPRGIAAYGRYEDASWFWFWTNFANALALGVALAAATFAWMQARRLSTAKR